MFPDPPPPGTSETCDTAGVLSPAVSVIASHAAAEAMKHLVGAEDALAGGVINVDVWDLSWHRFRISRKEDCPCCGLRQFPYLEAAAASHAVALCGRNAIQITVTRPTRLDLSALGKRLEGAGQVTVTSFLLKLDLGEHLLTVFPDARAIIQGTTDESLARSLYSRFVGL
jgi:adenylyltransferase/sulfurtransferase